MYLIEQDGKTALDIAIESGHHDCMQALKQHYIFLMQDHSLSPKFTRKLKYFSLTN